MSSSLPPTRLKLLRLARGLSQCDIAARAGVCQVSVSTCELGRPAPRALPAIARVLRVSPPERLLERIDDLEARLP